MRKINNNTVKIYGLLLNLYPRSYLNGCKTLMKQTFRDMLKEDSSLKVWIRVVKELPGSLIREHIENIKGGVMEITKRNNNLGLAVLILGYLTLVAWALAIFLGIEIGVGVISYFTVGFFVLFLLSSVVLLIKSMISNVKESKLIHKVSRGLKYTFIGIPPIAFCYFAIFVKGLTEGH